MNISYTGRHIEVTPALKNYVQEKIERMNKYSHKLIDINVILEVEKYRHIAEITMLVGRTKINGKDATNDMYASIDSCLDKIERQLRKHKEIISDHNAKSEQYDKFLGMPEEEAEEEELES